MKLRGFSGKPLIVVSTVHQAGISAAEFCRRHGIGDVVFDLRLEAQITVLGAPMDFVVLCAQHKSLRFRFPQMAATISLG